MEIVWFVFGQSGGYFENLCGAQAKQSRKFPRRYSLVANKKYTYFKATGLVPRCQYPVSHWLIGCHNNEWTSLNLR